MRNPCAVAFGLAALSCFAGCSKSRLTEAKLVDPLPVQKPVVMQTPSMQTQSISHKMKPY